MPLLASSFLLTSLAAIGFPGTLGFIGHELLVDGTVAQYPRTGFLVIAATAFGSSASSQPCSWAPGLRRAPSSRHARRPRNRSSNEGRLNARRNP
jgi:formate hydrogenlyase subunit 3/multisubunit Na+/H+ antiporter MnhD subunit